MSAGKYKLGDEPVPGYRLDEFLGRGGFGEVWKAIAPGGTEAALKIISLSGKQGLKEFRALRLVKRIRHPNLVPLVGYWLKDREGHLLSDAEASLDKLQTTLPSSSPLQGTMVVEPPPREGPRPVELIIAMGLGEQDLFRRLEECRNSGLEAIPLPELLRYMEDSARAIDYLNSPRHDLGSGPVAVQHCDIKPFNIMIVGGAAQVCDFGLARVLGDVRATATAGTLAYVAPECLSNNQPSGATDQYSLAVTYFELRTGKLPYDSEVYSQVVTAVLEGRLDLSSLPEAEQHVIRKATSLDPAQRYPTTLEMVFALRKAAESSQPEPKPSRLITRRQSIVLAVLALLFVSGVVVWQRWPDRIDDPGSKKGAREPTRGIAGNDLPERIKRRPAARNGKPRLKAGPKTTPIAASAATRAEAQALLDRGQERFSQGDYDEAAAKFSAAIAKLPKDAKGELVQLAYLLRGTCYLEQAEYAKAETDLTRAIVLNESDPRGYSRRGQVRLHTERFDAAIEDFTKAITIEPDALDYFARGLALGEKQELTGGTAYQPAIDDFTTALRMGHPDPMAVHEARAIAAAKAGDNALADRDDQIAELLKRLVEDPDDAEALSQAAWLLATAPQETVRDGARAEALARQACELSKFTNPVHLDALAAACAASGDFEQAAKWAKQAIEHSSDNPQAAEKYRARLEHYKNSKGPWVEP